MKKLLGDLSGAFADGAILFPLLSSLSHLNDFSAVPLLATSGIAYLVSGFIFKIPMPVQPLKSIAISAITMGATASEVRVGGALLGLFCLALTLFDFHFISQKISPAFVHSLQLSLGILLITQGFQKDYSLAHLGLMFGVYTVSKFISFPVLGLMSVLGLIWSIFLGSQSEMTLSPHLNKINPDPDQLRFNLILALTLPQMALTLANSVIGTSAVAHQYFGLKAKIATPRYLLYSIGIGNILSSAIGGLPYCHGSGGLTAHVRGGASHWRMNVMIGSFLILLSLTQVLSHDPNYALKINYPPIFLSSLLTLIGIFHLSLAKPTWKNDLGKYRLILVGSIVLITRHMLYALLAIIAIEGLTLLFSQQNQKKFEAFSIKK